MADKNLDTGVNSLEAADNNQEAGVFDIFEEEDYTEQEETENDDTAMSEFEITDDPDELGLEQFLAEQAEETSVKQGVTDPPKPAEAEKTDRQEEEEQETQTESTEDEEQDNSGQETKTEPFMAFNSQEELNEFMSKRINAVKQKTREQVEAEYAEKFGVPVDQLAEQAVEKRARELMEKFPERVGNDLEFAKVLARAQLPQTQQTQPKQEMSIENTQQSEVFDKNAFLTGVKQAEEAIRTITGDETFSIAELNKTNPFFKAALMANPFEPLAAYKEAMQAQKAQETKIKQAQSKAQSDIVDKMSQNANRVMKNTAKGTGKKTVPWGSTQAERDAYSEWLQSQG